MTKKKNQTQHEEHLLNLQAGLEGHHQLPEATRVRMLCTGTPQPRGMQDLHPFSPPAPVSLKPAVSGGMKLFQEL